jgi:hypothetical protein
VFTLLKQASYPNPLLPTGLSHQLICKSSNLENSMDFLPEFSQPAYYEFRVHGRLGAQSTSWFEGMTITIDESVSPVQTIIQGHIVDQAELYGQISRIRDLGLTLLSVKRIEQ